MRSPAEVASRARLRYFSKTCRALPRTRPSGPLLSKVWVRGCPPPPPPPCCLRLVRPRGRRPLLEPCLIVRSEEHTSELQSLMRISYAVFCLKKKNNL